MYKVFEKELNYITNEELKEFVIKCLKNVPEYFYHVSASSSGKYHPKQDLGKGGLIRHTKAVVQVALDLIRCEQFVEDDNYNRNVVVASSLLHDVIKNGFEDNNETVSEHPLLACEFVESVFNFSDKDYSKIWVYKNLIKNCIKSHMGKWNEDKEGNKILPLPSTELEQLVHLADYIASRKYVDMSLLEE